MNIFSKRLKSIQFLRCVAAIMVCISHLLQLNGYHNIVLLHIADSGVDLFFVISSFIITWLFIEDQKLPSFKRAFSFLVKRLFRIYPLFWTILFCIVIMHFILHIPVTKSDVNLKVLFLLIRQSFLVPQSWTLSFELYFYFNIFCFMCFCRKRWFLFVAVFWFLIHFWLFVSTQHQTIKLDILLFDSGNLMYFAYGIIVFSLLYFCPRLNQVVFILSFILGIILLFYLISLEQINVPYTRITVSFYYGSVTAMLVYGLVGLELQDKIIIPNCLVKLGDISYSIYLWHFFIHWLGILFSTYCLFYANLNGIIKVCFELFIVILWSFISYWYIELPAIQFSRNLSRRFLS